MTKINGLKAGSQIRVAGIMGKITVETLAAYAAEYGETVAEHVARDVKFQRETQYAWTLQHAAILTDNYAGKAMEMQREDELRAAAPWVQTGDVLVVDGQEYTARVLGNYSDPVKLTKI